MRARRGLLFVCGADPAALEAARGSDADSLILDLEDTVTPERKPRARALVAEALGQPARPGLERTVRVNPPSTSWFRAPGGPPPPPRRGRGGAPPRGRVETSRPRGAPGGLPHRPRVRRGERAPR